MKRDTRRDYGEERYQIYGRIQGRLYVVVCTLRSDVIRIISARKAREVEHHENGTRKD